MRILELTFHIQLADIRSLEGGHTVWSHESPTPDRQTHCLAIWVSHTWQTSILCDHMSLSCLTDNHTVWPHESLMPDRQTYCLSTWVCHAWQTNVSSLDGDHAVWPHVSHTQHIDMMSLEGIILAGNMSHSHLTNRHEQPGGRYRDQTQYTGMSDLVGNHTDWPHDTLTPNI